MKVGFIGAGTITEAVVTGLCEAGAQELSIIVSPRNRERSAALSERYDAVRVAPDNQNVIDQCDLVFLAMRPQDAGAVLSGLKFRQGQQVVSFIATISAADVEQSVKPAEFAGRVAPVPPAARGAGPVAISPPNERLAEFFRPIGTVIQVDDEAHIDAFFSVSALMAPYFELLETVTIWLREQGVEAVDADTYAGSLFRAIAERSTEPGGEGFAELVEEHATRAGINQQMRREMLATGFYDRIKAGLDLIQARMQGRATLADTLDPDKLSPEK